MTKIDETTGLPELPNDYFWKLGENSVSILKRLPDTEWRRKVEYGIEYPDQEADYFHSTRDIRHEVEPYSRTIYGNWFTPDRTEIETRRVMYYRYVNRAKTEERIDYEQVVDRDNALTRCEEVLTKWNTRTERESLYGEYPPKKLEA